MRSIISKSLTISFCVGIIFILNACIGNQHFQINMDDTLAWCIVPFDAKERTPQQRIEMLQELGFKAYAYDWREKHLEEMAQEIQLAKENGINMSAVWLWIDANSDSLGKLSPYNERLFSILEESGLKTTIWLSFNGNYFEGLPHDKALEQAVQMVEYISRRANELGCKVALYNHGEWFGDPRNQVEIIERLPDYEIGIIYNFHHAHEQLDDYPLIVKSMTPYLWAVNLNGMSKAGPKIMTIGEGPLEKMMIQFLWDAGFRGPWGILGHIETEDVKLVLERNIAGLKALQEP